MPADFYELLDVSENASRGDIKAAYRQKAREYHPDVNDDDRASAQFKTVRTAYEVLSDAEERKAYDRMGHATYVRKRLDGLPTAGMSRPSGNSRWSTGRTASASSTSSTSSTGGRRRSKSGGTAGQSQRTSRQSSTSTGSTGSARQSTASAGQSSRSTRTGTGARTSGQTSGRSATAGQSTGRRRNGTTGQRRTAAGNGQAQQTTASSRQSRRSPLWGPLGFSWVAVVVSGLVYAAGLGWYLTGRTGAVASFLGSLTTDPATALLTPLGLTDPLSYALGALAAPSPALLFPAGAALLLVVFGAVVYRFGQGPTWLYVAAAAGPVAGFGVRQSAVAPPAGADLLLFVGLPLVATAVFAVDLGRYLLASR